MRKKRHFWRRLGYVLGALLLLTLAGMIYLVEVSRLDPPKLADARK
jgi:hypothetical protein